MSSESQIHSAWRRLKFRVRNRLGCHPAGMVALSKFGSWTDCVVRRDSVVCIEGYPRCANTYSVAAFRISQDDFTSHIGRHTHLAGNVLRALDFGIPTLVLIREPRSAVSSLKIFDPDQSLEACLQAYIRFYSSLLDHRHRFVTAEFQEVTGAFDKVLGRLTAATGKEFRPFENDEPTKEACFRLVEEMDRRVNHKDTVTETQVARPSEVRKALRVEVEEQLGRSDLRPLVEEAGRIYEAFLHGKSALDPS